MSIKATVIGLSALSLFGSAHAVSSVVSTLSNFQLSTTGSVTQNHPASMYSETRVDGLGGGASGANNLSWGDWVHAVSDAASSPPGSLFASVSSAVADASINSFAAVNHQDMSMIASASTGERGGFANAYAATHTVFSLAAHSSLTLTWDASVTGSSTGEQYALGSTDSGQGYVSVGFGYIPAIGPRIDATTGSGQSQWLNGEHIGFSFESVGTSRKLTVATTDAPLEFSFSASVSASTIDYAVPVPEPTTWAMALAGLTLVGVGARRRVSHRSTPT